MYNKAEIGKRLKEFAKTKGSQAELAKQLGVSPTSLTDYFNGKTAPGDKMLHKLEAIGCYLPWLIFGITRRIITETTISEIRYFQNKYSFNNTRNDEYDTIIDFFKNDCEFKELLPIDNLLVAGYEEDEVPIEPLDLRTLVLQNKRTLFFCKVSGSSMEGYGIKDDDILVLRYSDWNPTSFNRYLTILDRFENDKLIIRKYDKESNQLLSGSKDLAPIPYDPELIVPARITSIIRPL